MALAGVGVCGVFVGNACVCVRGPCAVCAYTRLKIHIYVHMSLVCNMKKKYGPYFQPNFPENIYIKAGFIVERNIFAEKRLLLQRNSDLTQPHRREHDRTHTVVPTRIAY